MTADLSDELTIAFSELTTNAISSTADAGLPVRVHAWREGAELVLEVVNPSPDAAQPTQRWDRRNDLRSGGRGLQIVHAFVDTVEADQDDEGRLVVRCRRAIDEFV